MKVDFRSDSLAEAPAAALVVFGFEGNPSATGTASGLPEPVRALLRELQQSGELRGKPYETTLIHRPGGLGARLLLVIGAGKEEKCNPALLRRLAGVAVRHLRARAVHNLAWALAAKYRGPEIAQALVEGAIAGDYDSDRYRTERNGEKRIDELWLVTGPEASTDEERAAVARGQIIAEAQNFTRDLVNEPCNNLPPAILAERAQKMAAEYGLDCQVLDEHEIQRLKMGALWAVGQGSDAPPRVIVLRYSPPEAPAEPVIALVGKGITFDTGGISIKPAADMHEMKTDMAGGATMLGVMRAIAQLKPAVRVMCVIPAAENMPSGKAYRPGDVITSMSGKTIEVLNTDAEGRLA